MLGCALLSPGLAADSSAHQSHPYPAMATLRFDGTSTLHDFGGGLASQPFTLTLSNGTWSAAADVWAGAMNTSHEKRDRKMHEMFATNAFPKLRGWVTNAPIPAPGSGTESTAKLALQIRDRTNTVPVKISHWVEDPGSIRFEAVWTVSLRQFVLQPPSVLGVIRVGDLVQVRAEVVATKPHATGQTSPARPASAPGPSSTP